MIIIQIYTVHFYLIQTSPPHSAFPGITREAVSYTHLDVYKRQLLTFICAFQYPPTQSLILLTQLHELINTLGLVTRRYNYNSDKRKQQ